MGKELRTYAQAKNMLHKILLFCLTVYPFFFFIIAVRINKIQVPEHL